MKWKKIAIQEQPERVCPKCNKKYKQYPTLSRRDNKTEICPDCGVAEAMEDYRNYLKKKKSSKHFSIINSLYGLSTDVVIDIIVDVFGEEESFMNSEFIDEMFDGEYSLGDFMMRGGFEALREKLIEDCPTSEDIIDNPIISELLGEAYKEKKEEIREELRSRGLVEVEKSKEVNKNG